MAVYEQTYRRYTGPLTAPIFRAANQNSINPRRNLVNPSTMPAIL